MTYELVLADPAKNITLLVLTPVENREEAAKLLLEEPALQAEQVGFVIPPKTSQNLWRLEMMGGEFCGNAARAFGFFVARTLGLSGSTEVPIEISGMRDPLLVNVQVEAGTAEVKIPKPLAQDTLDFRGAVLPVYRFEGITHVIAPGIVPAEHRFFAIKDLIEAGSAPPPALGVMFYDQDQEIMTPGVYVYGTNSLVFESSCGSGSAAFGVWQNEMLWEGEGRCYVTQPGGVIEVRVGKQHGRVTELSIGGPLSVSAPILLER